MSLAEHGPKHGSRHGYLIIDLTGPRGVKGVNNAARQSEGGPVQPKPWVGATFGIDSSALGRFVSESLTAEFI